MGPVIASSTFAVREYGSAVMYAKGKILIAGGDVSSGTHTSSAQWLDLTATTPVWRSAGQMQYKRMHLNTTLLPDGKVLVTGGNQSGTVNEYEAVLPAELWTPPATGTTGTGSWQTLAPMQVPRLYHSTAVLLPDGRVLSTGGGAGGGFENHPDYEVFSPPYLFSGPPRPQITAAPVAIKYGQSFQVTIDPTVPVANIAQVRLVRLSSVTHSFNMNQRGVDLTISSRSGTTLTIAPPTSADDWCPPGHYMLFAVSSAGVPSVARILSISSNTCLPSLTLTPSTLSTTGCVSQMRVTAAGQNLGSTFYWTVDGVPVPGNASTYNFQQGLNSPNKYQHRIAVSVLPGAGCGTIPVTAEIAVTSYFPTCLPD